MRITSRGKELGNKEIRFRRICRIRHESVRGGRALQLCARTQAGRLVFSNDDRGNGGGGGGSIAYIRKAGVEWE